MRNRTLGMREGASVTVMKGEESQARWRLTFEPELR